MGPTPPGGAAKGGRATLWCGQPMDPLLVSFRLHVLPGKIGTSGFVASNSENIFNITFLKPKIAENRIWRSGILLIG